MGKKGVIVLETKIIKSKAFRTLRKSSMVVLLDFLARRKMVSVGRKGHEKWHIENNGKIVYPYIEAERMGMHRNVFRNAIDQLIEHGFIDLEHQGHGGRKVIDENGKLVGDMNKYAISERWRQFGKPDFKTMIRKKDTRRGRGWDVFHRLKN
jgi:hypothetical protein